MNKFNTILVAIGITVLIGLFAVGAYSIYPTNIRVSQSQNPANQSGQGSASIAPDAIDQDTVYDIAKAMQKVPADTLPSNYFTKLNNLIKGF